MKKLLLAVAVLLGGVALRAEDVSVDIGGLKFLLPMQQVSVVQLYDFDKGSGFTGAETNLITKDDLALTFGGATSTDGTPGFPYLGLNFRLPSPPFDTSNNALKFGVYIGNNLKKNGRVTSLGIYGSVGLF